MRVIGIRELEGKIDLLANLNEPLKIVDKKRDIELAFVYPIKRKSVVDSLAGSLTSYTDIKIENLDEAREKAFELAMREKYGLSD